MELKTPKPEDILYIENFQNENMFQNSVTKVCFRESQPFKVARKNGCFAYAFHYAGKQIFAGFGVEGKK